MVLNLPYPPSANRYLRHTARGTYRTAEADGYRESVRAIASSHPGIYPIKEMARLSAVLHPRMTRRGAACKTRLDLDNCIKVVVDALQGVCYLNDRQLNHISTSIGAPKMGGGLTVAVVENPERTMKHKHTPRLSDRLSAIAFAIDSGGGEAGIVFEASERLDELESELREVRQSAMYLHSTMAQAELLLNGERLFGMAAEDDLIETAKIKVSACLRALSGRNFSG